MSYNMDDENMCNDCGVRLVQCDMCGCCSACCDCEEIEQVSILPPLPQGGYFKACCPDWATDHVVPIFKKGEVIWWECSHCGLEHYADRLNEWNDIPF